MGRLRNGRPPLQSQPTIYCMAQGEGTTANRRTNSGTARVDGVARESLEFSAPVISGQVTREADVSQESSTPKAVVCEGTAKLESGSILRDERPAVSAEMPGKLWTY